MTGVDTVTGIIFPYANFVLFLVLLWRFTKKPARAAAEKKSEDYKLLYEKASASYEEAKTRLDRLGERYSSLEKEIEAIDKQAKLGAEARSKGLLEEADRMSERLSLEAQQVAQREAVLAKEHLKKELWVKAKGELLDRMKNELTVKKQKEFLWSSLEEVGDLKK